MGQMLTEISGSSDYFWGGVISYDNTVKVGLLGVNSQDLEKVGAVSATVAEQMAVGVRSRLGTTWGLSITGIAGPMGGAETSRVPVSGRESFQEDENKPVGLVYIGLAGPEGVISVENRFGAARGRSLIRHLSACTALDLLRRQLVSQLTVNSEQ
jgi:nicotinamide-nucleotide amidase